MAEKRLIDANKLKDKLSEREAHLCMRTENGWPTRRRRKADDFCSYGERKANG